VKQESPSIPPTAAIEDRGGEDVKEVHVDPMLEMIEAMAGKHKK